MPATETPARRVISAPEPPAGTRLPTGWARGVVAGLEAATLAWLTVVVPAVATYVATAAAPALGEASWTTAAAVGTALWLLGHGAAAGGVTLVPLGVTLLALALVYGSTRRMRVRSYGAAAFVVPGYVLGVGVLGLLAGGAPAGALLLAAAVAAAGALPAARRGGAPTPRWLVRTSLIVPPWVGAGVRTAVAGAIALATGAVALTVVALVQGAAQVRELHEGLVADPVSTTALLLAQAAFLPTVVVWALAWLAGPGFAVGSGTEFSPELVTGAVLPAVPLLGGLPEPGTPGLGWVVLVPVALGLVLGGHLHHRHPQPTVPRALLSAVVMATAVAALAALAVLAASGGVGEGRMAELGASAPAVAGALLAELGAGAAISVVALHPRTRQGGRAGLRRAGGHLRRRGSEG